MKLLILLILVVSVGCSPMVTRTTSTREYKEPVIIQVEEAAEFDICFPPRGEEQEPALRVKGKAYNTMPYGCI